MGDYWHDREAQPRYGIARTAYKVLVESQRSQAALGTQRYPLRGLCLPPYEPRPPSVWAAAIGPKLGLIDRATNDATSSECDPPSDSTPSRALVTTTFSM